MKNDAPANLFAEYGRFLGGPGGWPDHYLVVDIETCGGLVVENPFVIPVELGWCLVEGRRVVSNDSVLINWPAVVRDYTRFCRELAKTRADMHAKGANYRFTPGLLEDEGVMPAEGLTLLSAVVAETVAAGGSIVGHNLVSFDYPILARCMREWTEDATFEPPIDRIVDTMCVVRARQKRDFALPGRGETRRQWYDRLSRGPEKCSMFEFALPTFSVSFDATKAHMAVYDTYVNHLLLEAMRRLAEE